MHFYPIKMKFTINRLMTSQLYLCSKRSVYPYVSVTVDSSLCCFQVYACMMVFFLSNMFENQLMSTGAFEITFNGELFAINCNFWAGTGLFMFAKWNTQECHEFDIVFVFINLFFALDVPVWSKLESGHLPSMQQLVQILDNEMKMNVHMNTRPHHS